MQYTGGESYSLAINAVENKQNAVLDLAEQLMNTETKESFVKNIQLFYNYVGNSIKGDVKGGKMLLPHADSQNALFDRLVELGYYMHKEKWRKKGLGYFVPNWATQAVLEDDIYFEHYLDSLSARALANPMRPGL